LLQKLPRRPPARKFDDNDLVPVRIGYTEKDLIESAKTAKGRWNPDVRLWFIRYGTIKGAALEKHIVLDAITGK
jgi:hypothetical protein